MTAVGTLQAKNRLSELIERVGRGERILITHRGKPAAMLVPPEQPENSDVAEVIRQMRELRKGNRLGPNTSVRELIDEGRR